MGPGNQTSPGAYKNVPLAPNTKSIRILDVHAASPSDTHQGQIRGELRVIDLEKSPTFVALSYVWGDYAVPRHTIACGGNTLETTANCYSALVHLRQAIGAFSIWIDAICINQADREEKSSQIPLMGSIYSKAKVVYIWLGAGNSESDRAMDYLATAGFLEFFTTNGEFTGDNSLISPRPWAAAWRAYTYSWSFTQSIFFRDREKWPTRLLRRLHIVKALAQTYTSSNNLNDVLERAWIGRMWTYQEILLASNPVVVCGNKHIPWPRFMMSIQFIDWAENDWAFTARRVSTASWRGAGMTRILLAESPTNNAIPSSHSTDDGEAKVLQFEYRKFTKSLALRYLLLRVVEFSLWLVLPVVPVIVWTRKHSPYTYILVLLIIICVLLASSRYLIRATPTSTESPLKPNVRSAQDIIVELCTRNATEPKDKAFAVQAVLQKLPISPLIPDYNKSISTIYQELSAQLLQGTNSLQILLPASVSPLQGAPSWVPNWAADFESLWLKASFAFDRRKNNSTRDSVSCWRWDAQNRLVIRAYSPWTIAVRCPKFKKTADSYHESEKSIHEENLRAILDLFRYFIQNRTQLKIDTWGTLDSWFLAAGHGYVFVPSHEMSNRDTENVFKYPIDFWVRTMLRACEMPPLDALTLFTSDRRLPWKVRISHPGHSRYRQVMPLQIKLCNDLAETGRTLFVTAGSSVTIGTCSDEAQIHDNIALISGMSVPLITRPQGDSHRIVSPALVADAMEGQFWNPQWNEESLPEFTLI